MIQLQVNPKYRVGMEPFKMLIEQFNLPIEIKKFQIPQEILPYMVNDKNAIKNLQDMEKLILDQLKVKGNQPLLITEDVDQNLKSKINSLFEKAQESSCNPLNEQAIKIIKSELEFLSHYFKTNNQKYLFSQNHVTFQDILLLECLIFINSISPFWIYEEFQPLYQYKCRVLTLKHFQNYWFDVNLLQLPFGPTIPNPLGNVKTIIHNNLKNFHTLAICYGILYKYKEENIEQIDNCPVSLFPCYINYNIIDDLKQKSILQQQLIDKMSHHFEWYSQIFSKLSSHDKFINKMLEIQQKVEQSKTKCKYNLCIVRNDFLHQSSENKWLQVEYNCIAISFGFISDRVQKLHTDLFRTYYSAIAQRYHLSIKQDWNKDMLIEALSNSHYLYGQAQSQILIIAGEFEGNLFDQKYMEVGLMKRNIICIRTTFLSLINNIELKQDGRLFAFGKEISVVYFRTGYCYEQYENEDCWKVREIIELSQAIKCPSLNIQLVNFKKIQQILLDDKQINKFMSANDSLKLKENYCKIWGFDNPEEYQQIYDMVEQNPEDYVLKPQREGGGNNFYDHQIVEQLNKIPSEERNQYILMERIKPVPRVGFMLRKGQLDIQAVISEISVLGYFISQEQKIIKNEVGGYLIRTKRYLDNEGGVAAGYAVVDSFMTQDVSIGE